MKVAVTLIAVALVLGVMSWVVLVQIAAGAVPVVVVMHESNMGEQMGKTERYGSANCPIREFTGDGVSVGRCWFYMPDGKTCPRHGDVSVAVATYLATSELTDERVPR